MKIKIENTAVIKSYIFINEPLMELIQKRIKNQLNVYLINDISNIIFEYADDSHFYSNEINKGRIIKNEYLTILKDRAAKSVTIIEYFKNLEKIFDFAKDITELSGTRGALYHRICNGKLYFNDYRGNDCNTMRKIFSKFFDGVNLKIYEGWERFVDAYELVYTTKWEWKTLETLFEFVNLYQ